MTELFVIPAATTTIARVSEYSAPWFETLLPVAYVAIGVSMGVVLILFFVSIINSGVSRLFNYDEILAERKRVNPFTWNDKFKNDIDL